MAIDVALFVSKRLMPVAIALFLLTAARLATCLATSAPMPSPGEASAGASPTEIRVLIAH